MSENAKNLKALANGAPDDVIVQIETAYALDGQGDETGAVECYDRAYRLGVPEEHRAEFLLGYGSTLKNVGRLEESEKILRDAIATHPELTALRAFLALTLQAQTRSGEAIAELLRLLLDSAPPDSNVQLYAQALSEYAGELAASSD